MKTTALVLLVLLVGCSQEPTVKLTPGSFAHPGTLPGSSEKSKVKSFLEEKFGLPESSYVRWQEPKRAELLSDESLIEGWLVEAKVNFAYQEDAWEFFLRDGSILAFKRPGAAWRLTYQAHPF